MNCADISDIFVVSSLSIPARFSTSYPTSFIFRDYAGEIPGIMKAFYVLPLLFVAIVAEDEFCYKNVAAACRNQGKTEVGFNCTSSYGGIEHVLQDLQTYANTHISRSHEYLMMSTHYANYEKNRAGFEKLFRSLSDDKWNQAIELIKYITKRGGSMDFNQRKVLSVNLNTESTYELYELESISMALDIEKKLALDSNSIHREASAKSSDHHDPEVAHYIEEEFSEDQAKRIRKLAGYATDLKSLISSQDYSISLYLFDEYLQKQ